MTNSEKNINIIITGVGGQGILVASQLIGNMAVSAGLTVRVSEDIGMAQRGGSVVSHIRIGPGVYSPLITLNSADLVLGFEPLETYRNVVKYLKPQGDVVFNAAPAPIPWTGKETAGYPPLETIIAVIKKVARNVIALDAATLARSAGNAGAVNMVMLGAATAMVLPFQPGDVANLIKDTLSGDQTANIKALNLGFDEVKKRVGAPPTKA